MESDQKMDVDTDQIVSTIPTTIYNTYILLTSWLNISSTSIQEARRPCKFVNII